MYIKEWLKQNYQEKICRHLFSDLNQVKTFYIEKNVGNQVFTIPIKECTVLTDKDFKDCYQKLLDYEWDYELEYLVQEYLSKGVNIQDYTDHNSIGRIQKGANQELADYIFAVFCDLVKKKYEEVI